MTTSARARYTGYRFPAEIISHAVWLYFRFPLGLRMVEELLAARGIIVSAAVGRQIWPAVRQADPSPAPAHRRQMASRRGCAANARPATGVRSCIEDEGRPLEAGRQGLASNYRKLRRQRAVVVSVAEEAGPDPVR